MSDTLFSTIDKSADLSPCRKYRFTLWRLWSDEPYANFICLNPSTADENTDDRTVKKCMTLARNWGGFGGICITNLFAFRSKSPQIMKAQPAPIGFQNDAWIQRIARDAGIIIAAWSGHAGHLNRSESVKDLLKEMPLYYLRKNEGCEPWHPLYLPNDTKPTAWSY